MVKWRTQYHSSFIGKISAELGEKLLEVPKKKAQVKFVEGGFICRVHTFVSYTRLETDTSGKEWQLAEETEQLNELFNAG